MFQFLTADWIRGADPGTFWFTAILAWTACLGGLLLAWLFTRRLRLIEDTPQSLIRSAAQGYLELRGNCCLMPGQPIMAPLTRQRCVWWSYRIEERVNTRRSLSWETVGREISGELFFVDDGTGQCVIDPEHASVYPTTRDVWYGDSEMPEGGPSLGKFAVGSRYRYVEERIHEQEPLYALGYFHTQGPPSGSDIDLGVRQLLAEWKRDQAELRRRFDTNNDGVVDEQEWETARTEARRQVLEMERENLKRPPLNVLSRPPDDREFILSTVPRSKLMARFKLYTVLCLLAFLCAGAVGTRLLSVRLADLPVSSRGP